MQQRYDSAIFARASNVTWYLNEKSRFCSSFSFSKCYVVIASCSCHPVRIFTISASTYHFALGDWGEFQDEKPFIAIELPFRDSVSVPVSGFRIPCFSAAVVNKVYS